ncbi:hypothetical protein KH5H1_60920 [Corallococcus caeni]|uniref:autotransporter outer membrane beta-barrel domain-containing protein n=1 Tax=Corallococcus caeni TaxID=3082388 RepID=UPI0029574DEC|nr:hypothetical protein KH5H1_60920 [Corallococcus sp. KH5-1]
MSLMLLGALMFNPRVAAHEAPAAHAAPAAHEAPAAQAVPVTHEVPAAPVASAAPGLPWLGLMLDTGIPEGAGVSLALRPLRMLRLHGGVVHNAVSLGGRFGASFIPLQAFVRPTLTAEVGRLPEGNARRAIERVAGTLGAEGLLLERVGYDFANVHLGLELGSARRFSFFLRGGLSYVRTRVHGVEDWSKARASDVTVESITAPRVSGTLPTLKLGFLLYLG